MSLAAGMGGGSLLAASVFAGGTFDVAGAEVPLVWPELAALALLLVWLVAVEARKRRSGGRSGR